MGDNIHPMRCRIRPMDDHVHLIGVAQTSNVGDVYVQWGITYIQWGWRIHPMGPAYNTYTSNGSFFFLVAVGMCRYKGKKIRYKFLLKMLKFNVLHLFSKAFLYNFHYYIF